MGGGLPLSVVASDGVRPAWPAAARSLASYAIGHGRRLLNRSTTVISVSPNAMPSVIDKIIVNPL